MPSSSHLQQRRDATKADTEGTLEGVVVDANTRRPIADAVVALAPRTGAPMMGSGGATIPHALSDTAGAFVIDAPAGDYHLTAAAAGFLPTTVDRVHVEAAGARTTVVLRPGGTQVSGTLTDITGGEIEGTLVVARPQGALRPGAPDSGIIALSDAEGRYVLSLAEGRWSLEAGGDAYARAVQRVSLRQAAARVDFQLVPAAAIHGRVLDRATGAPVVDAAVAFEHYVSSGRGYSVQVAQPDEGARTDNTGAFVLRGLAPGSYSVFATARSRASRVEAVVPVGFGEQVDGVVVLVDPAFDVSGFVVDAADRERGLGDVVVSAMQLQPSRQWTASTDAAGYFELLGVPAGGLPLAIRGEGMIASDLEQRIRVDAHSGRAAPQIFVLERGAAVSGQLSPPSAATVQVVPRQRSGGLEMLMMGAKLSGARARVGENGSFTIPGVAPGEWRLEATADDGSVGEVDIAVTPEGLDDVAVTLVPRAIVRGRVLDRDGRALTGVSAVLVQDRDVPMRLRRGSPENGIMTDAEGRFEILGSEPGVWGVDLFDSAGQELVVIGEAPRIVIAEGDTAVDVELRAELPDGRITGIVVDAQGDPIADAWVDAAPAARPTVTDADGRFVFEGLADDVYSVHARAGDDGARGELEEVALGSDVRVEVELPGSVRGIVTMGGVPLTTFTVTAGEARRGRTFITPDGSFELDRLRPGEIEISVSADDGAATVIATVVAGETIAVPVELGSWGRVTGRLVSATDGAPQGGVEIAASATSGVRSGANDGLAALFGGAPSADAAGAFEIDGLGPGAIELRFSRGKTMHGGQALGRRLATLGAGETVDLGDIVVLPPVDVAADERGWFGLESRLGVRPDSPREVPPADRDAPKHVWVIDVAPGGPAAVAGVRVGDRIDAIDGLRVEALGAATLLDAMRPSRLEVGSTHEIEVSRDGAAMRFTVGVRPQ